VKAASVIVLDAKGWKLSPTTQEKAKKLLAEGRAKLVSKEGESSLYLRRETARQEPLIIPLPNAVELSGPKEVEREKVANSLPISVQRAYTQDGERVCKVGEGKRILLHICCAPCATYPVERLRAEGFAVTGFWYNPNIHPWMEHERRRESVQKHAEAVDLPMIWHGKYEMPLYLRAVVGHERFGERCRICYRLRLEKAAQTAAEGGFDAFTTTLLISPHQDQALIREIGEGLATEHGVEFHFENFRRGWSERGRLTREHGFYRQQYCGCIYSEWERYNKACIDTLIPLFSEEAK